MDESQISIGVSRDVYARLADAARIAGVSIDEIASELVSTAIRRALKEPMQSVT